VTTLYSTHLHDRSYLERSFLRVGCFAHISEGDIKSAFDDVENGTAEIFEYQESGTPTKDSVPYGLTQEDYNMTWSTEDTQYFCKKFDRYTQEWFNAFWAEPIARLIIHRHNLLCHLCYNPCATFYYHRMHDFMLRPHLGIGKEWIRFPNVCGECTNYARLLTPPWNDELLHCEKLVLFMTHLKRGNSVINKRLRSAPALRFTPTRNPQDQHEWFRNIWSDYGKIEAPDVKLWNDATAIMAE
jgi:hypothetical protein